MVLLAVLHRVRASEAWRKVYDEVAPSQEAEGISTKGIYRGKGDSNNVLVLHGCQTITEAEKFVGSAALHQAFEEAGVVGQLRVESDDEAERRLGPARCGNDTTDEFGRLSHPLVIGDEFAECPAQGAGGGQVNRVKTPEDNRIKRGGCLQEFII